MREKNFASAVVFIALLTSLIFTLNEGWCQSHFQCGPSAGFGLKTLRGTGQNGSGIGYRVGAISSLNIKNRLYIMPGISLSGKGYYFYESSEWYSLNPYSHEEDLKLTYLDFTLPLAIRLSNVCYFQAGLQGGFLMSAKYKTTDFEEVVDFKTAMNTFDYGAITGFNFQLKNGLGFDIMANIGLRDIMKEDYKDIFSSLNGKNMLWTTGVYYLFGHKAKKAK